MELCILSGFQGVVCNFDFLHYTHIPHSRGLEMAHFTS